MKLKLKDKLQSDKLLFEKQLTWLEISYQQCQQIGLKEDYSVDEFGYFETLCSRYSRSIDFLIRKMFRTIDEYEFENQGTLIDVINNAHKRHLFENIEDLREMKDIRNTISHEYIEDALAQVFDDILQFTPKLITIMKTTADYVQKSAL